VIDMGSGYPAAYRNGAGTGFQGSSRTSALEAAVAETQRQQAAKALNDAIAENERAGRAHKDPVSGAFRGKYGGGRGALGNPKAPGGAKLPFSGPLRAAQSAVSLYQKGRQAWDVEGGPTPISGWELVPGGCPPTAYVCGPEFGPGASACLSGQAGDCGDVGTLDGCSLDMSAIFHEDWPPHIGSHVRHYAWHYRRSLPDGTGCFFNLKGPLPVDPLPRIRPPRKPVLGPATGPGGSPTPDAPPGSGKTPVPERESGPSPNEERNPERRPGIDAPAGVGDFFGEGPPKQEPPVRVLERLSCGLSARRFPGFEPGYRSNRRAFLFVRRHSYEG